MLRSIEETTRSTWWTPVERTGGPPSTCLFHLLSSPVAHGTAYRTRIEAALEQTLPQLPLRGEPQEQPREGDDRDERALDHHDAPREPLVVDRRHAERARRDLVE